MLKHLQEEDISRLRKKLKEEAKLIRTGKSRSFYITEFMSSGKDIVSFLTAQHLNFNVKFKEENDRAWAYLTDKEEAEKFGFYDEKDFKVGGKYYVEGSKNQLPNQKQDQIIAWAEKASVKIERDLWAFELEVELFNKEMTSRNLPLFIVE